MPQNDNKKIPGPNAGKRKRPANIQPDYVAGVMVPKPVPKWWKRIKARTIWGVLVPIFVVFFYWMIWATDRYHSESRIIIRDAGSVNGGIDSLSLIGSISPEQKDALLVKEYILSWDMLAHLDQQLNLREHYSQPRIDFLSRMSPDASRESFLSYYREFIYINFDDLSSTLHLEVQAFDREMARDIAQAVIEQSETFLNLIGNELAQEQMTFVNTELERARASLKSAKMALIRFQEVNNTFSPQQKSEAMMGLISSLEADIARSEAELKEQGAYLVEDAPQMVAVRARINALQNQLAEEKRRLVGSTKTDSTISKVNAEYQDLLLSIGFATDIYTAVLTSLEQARLEAYQKLKHLVVVDPPVLADDSEYPARLHSLITSVVLILILYALAVMIYATIREHRDA